MRRVLPGLLALLAALTGCSSAGGHGQLRLDGSPRVFDVAGDVRSVDVSARTLTLGSGRTLVLRRDLQVVSTYTGAAVPVANTPGHFVEVGLRGKDVAWIAVVSSVVGNPPVATYTGVFKRFTSHVDAVFSDGTVLRLASRPSRVPPAGATVQATINARRGVVTDLRPA
jgi:hypothetical protein